MRDIRRSYRFAAFEQDPSTFDNTGDNTFDQSGNIGGASTTPGTVDPSARTGHYGQDVSTRVSFTAPWTIPSDIIDYLTAASDERVSGIPRSLLASTLWNLTHNWNRITPQVVVEVAAAIKRHYDTYQNAARPAGEPFDSYTAWLNAATDYASQSPNGSSNWANYRSTIQAWSQRNFDPGPESNPPTGKYRTPDLPENIGNQLVYGIDATGTAAGADIQDVYDYFESFIGRAPKGDSEAQPYVGMSLAALRVALENTPEGQVYRQYGDQIKSIKQQATQLWRQYMFRDPTTEELVNAVKGGLDSTDKLEAWLRNQPYGKGSTLGTYSDVRQAALTYAQQFLGRNPDSAGQEINWLISQGFTRPDEVSAFYEQLKDRQITGDPNFSWVGNPDQWKKTESEIQSVWQQEGLSGTVDPRLVNQAVSGGWTTDQMKDYVDNLPAPGFAEGITVGQVNIVRSYASKWKEHYLPGETLTTAELQRFIGMTSDEVQGYYRSLPLGLHVAALQGNKQGQDQTGGPTYLDPKGGTDAVPTQTGGVGDVVDPNKQPTTQTDPNAGGGWNPQNLRGIPVKDNTGQWGYVDPGTGRMR